MTMHMPEITVQELEILLEDNSDLLLIDVRSYGEFELVNIGGVHIPLDELERRLPEIDKSKDIYCLCHHGVRSQYAQSILLKSGAMKVFNIIGGIDAWSIHVDDSVATY